MRKLIWPGRILAVFTLLAGLAFFILWFFPSDSYLLLPDKAHPVAPLVRVKGGKSQARGPGGIYFLDVIERKATLLEDLFPSIRTGATLVPRSAIKPPGVSDAASHRADLSEMVRSQQVAAAVALRELGYKVVARPSGALVSAIAPGAPADGALVPTDVITTVDGHPVRTPDDARALLRQQRPGQTVTLGVRDQHGIRQVPLKTIADPGDRTHAIIGVLIEQAAQISLPFPVTIDTGNVGGPSAGLALALEVMEKLGRDVDRGYRIAATGELGLDGSVNPIGGVRQKIYGARQSGVDILLVPAGDNADVARRYAGKVRVIPVKTFRQALRSLATLPKKG